MYTPRLSVILALALLLTLPASCVPGAYPSTRHMDGIADSPHYGRVGWEAELVEREGGDRMNVTVRFSGGVQFTKPNSGRVIFDVLSEQATHSSIQKMIDAKLEELWQMSSGQAKTILERYEFIGNGEYWKGKYNYKQQSKFGIWTRYSSTEKVLETKDFGELQSDEE